MNESLPLSEIKSIELEILRYIDKVCAENGIPYYLDSGTLLGAVRHKGFIPWDDDIDLVVDRKDYRKLLDLLDQSNERFKVLSMYHTKDYQYPFAKLVDTHTKLVEHSTKSLEGMGVFVDLFPLEHMPNQKMIRRIEQAYIKWLRSIMSLLFNDETGHSKMPEKYKLVCMMYRKMGWQGVQKKLDTFLTKRAQRDTEYLVSLVAASNPYRDVKRSVFATLVDLPFEGETFKAPVGYKEYLEILFGDYMTLPPEEQRVTNHSFDVYRR